MKPIWLEEYNNCSCTFIADKKRELLGWCPRHGTPRKYAVKLLEPEEEYKKGYEETT